MAWKPLVALGICLWPAWAQNSLPEKETLSYNIEWRLITAGKAKIQWLMGQGGSGQINVRVNSAGLVSKLFKVEDTYATYFGPGLCTQQAQMTTNEGSRARETKITFDYPNHKADYLERDRVKNATILAKETDIPGCTHDITSALFYLRTLNVEPGQSVQIPVTDGKKSVSAKVEAQQREEIKTPAGTFKTIRYEAYLFNNVLYRRPAHLQFWLTDDRRKLPVQIRVRMQFTVGTINLELEKVE